MNFLMTLPFPTIVLAAVAMIGYMVGRKSKQPVSDTPGRSRRELRRAQLVAAELEKIAWDLRKALVRHHASVSKFRERVGKLNEQQAGGRLEGPLPRGRGDPSPHAPPGGADFQRPRRNPPAKRQPHDLHRGPHRSAHRREQSPRPGRVVGHAVGPDESLRRAVLPSPCSTSTTSSRSTTCRDTCTATRC